MKEEEGREEAAGTLLVAVATVESGGGIGWRGEVSGGRSVVNIIMIIEFLN